MKICPHCSEIFFSDQWVCPKCHRNPENNKGFVSFAAPTVETSFRPEFFSQLASLEESNFWFVARNKLIAYFLAKRNLTEGSFLEVGCGTGFVLGGIGERFPKLRLTGSEYFAEGLPFTKTRFPRAELIQADARQLPYLEEFDLIGAFDVLEHIEEDDVALTSMYRALRPSGSLLITVPQHPWLWSATDEVACHQRRYTRRELLQKLNIAGFKIEEVTSFVLLLLPVMAASRWIRRSCPNQDPMSELKLHPLVNRIFAGLMIIEKAFIRCGLRLPWGSSLLVVAKKA